MEQAHAAGRSACSRVGLVARPVPRNRCRGWSGRRLDSCAEAVLTRSDHTDVVREVSWTGIRVEDHASPRFAPHDSQRAQSLACAVWAKKLGDLDAVKSHAGDRHGPVNRARTCQTSCRPHRSHRTIVKSLLQRNRQSRGRGRRAIMLACDACWRPEFSSSSRPSTRWMDSAALTAAPTSNRLRNSAGRLWPDGGR